MVAGLYNPLQVVEIQGDSGLDEQSIASRLVNYADALVGVTVVGVSGLSFALMDSSSRCSVSGTVIPVTLGSGFFAAVVLFLLIKLRQWEMDVLADTAVPKKAELYSRRLYIARLVIVVVSAIAAITFLVSAAGDPNCVM